MELDPFILRQIMLGVFPPGIAGVLLFAALWWGRCGGEGGRVPVRAWLLTPLLLASLYIPLHRLVIGTLAFPPKEGSDWLPVAAVTLAIASVVVALVDRAGRSRRGGGRMAVLLGVLLLSAAAVTAGAWLVAGSVRERWSFAAAAGNLGPLVALGLAGALGAHFAAVRRPGASGALAVLVVAAGASQVLVLAFHSLKLAQSAGLWAALLGGAVLVGFFRKGLTIAYGGAALAGVMVVLAAFQGLLLTYTDYAWLHTAMIASGFVLAAVGTLWNPAGGGWRRGLAFLAPSVMAIIPLLVSIAVTLLGDSGGEYEY